MKEPKQIITLLEGTAYPNKSMEIIDNFRKATSKLPQQATRSYLLKNASVPDDWKIITIWKDINDLHNVKDEASWQSNTIFCAAGSNPKFLIYEIQDEAGK